MVLSEEVSFMKVYDKNILINTCFSRTSLSVCITHTRGLYPGGSAACQRGLTRAQDAGGGSRLCLPGMGRKGQRLKKARSWEVLPDVALIY